MNARRDIPDGSRTTTVFAEIAVLLSTIVAILSFTNINRQFIIVLVVPAILLAAALYLVSRRLYSVTVVNTTIAIAGPVGAGKTVYINVLCNQLLEGESPLLSFVPETQTVQHIYRAVGNLRSGQWPRPTATDHIDRFRGTVGFNRIPLIRVMLNGRLEFKVEFGDAAGENYKELAEEANARIIPSNPDNASYSGQLIESNFFTYVGESDCLFYFIDAKDLFQNPSRVAEYVDELLATLQLLRAIDGVGPRMPLQRPIAIILSKVDELPHGYLDLIARTISDFEKNGARDSHEPIISDGYDLVEDISFRQLRRLMNVLSKQSRSYRIFLVSALAEATSGLPETVVKNSRLENWQEYRTEAPLEWAFQELWQLRRFRAIAGGPSASRQRSRRLRKLQLTLWRDLYASSYGSEGWVRVLERAQVNGLQWAE